MYVVGIDETAVATDPEFKAGQLGVNHDGKVYKYVQYDTGAGGVAAVSGQVAYYYTLDGYKNHQVTSDLSDSVEIGAGVLQSAPTDGQYCWIQIKGPATLSIALTAGADGDPLTPTGATDGTLDVTAAATSIVCAYAGDASDNEIVCDFPF
ncbi:MAG: hypothetical protein MJA83_15840 [Gammaproteobacteria bacterium]|nr:hypothetical protein [Gammaproteobacteria bacterium]